LSQSKKTIIVSGGGTGGHIYPALAVARKIEKKGYGVIYIGSGSGLERDFVDMKNMYLLPTVGWVNKNLIGKIIFVFRFIPGFIFSVWLIISKKVCAVFNTGAFASLPVSLAGVLLGVPVFTLVLDSKPGKAVNFLSRFSKEVFLPYEDAFPSLKGKKKVVTGIPLREDLTRGKYGEAVNYFSLMPGKKTLLVIGGSRGAKFLAELSENLIPLMKKDWQFIIQRGDFKIISDHKWVRQFSFIDRMDLAYALSDVIISRAGALATAEIENTGIPAILIPYPYAFRDHQFFNAKRLALKRNNIIIRREEEVDVKNFPKLIERILKYVRKV
jgi:UDP-N-acetylglucosamine--N-acetylmuramyl-(pentapeptide) pyrophosphoryl-undecaprenol N-acetylglucosamine transferase